MKIKLSGFSTIFFFHSSEFSLHALLMCVCSYFRDPKPLDVNHLDQIFYNLKFLYSKNITMGFTHFGSEAWSLSLKESMIDTCSDIPAFWLWRHWCSKLLLFLSFFSWDTIIISSYKILVTLEVRETWKCQTFFSLGNHLEFMKNIKNQGKTQGIWTLICWTKYMKRFHHLHVLMLIFYHWVHFLQCTKHMSDWLWWLSSVCLLCTI